MVRSVFPFNPISSWCIDLCSHQATNASSWFYLSITGGLRKDGVPRRRPLSVLRLVPDHIMHDCTLHGDTIHGVRVSLSDHESSERV